MASYKHPIVGTVRFQALSGGRIRLLDNWAENNISTVYIPELDGVPTYGGPFSGNVKFYTPAIPQLKAAFAEIGAKGLTKDILFWDGSFVPRMKRGSSTSPSEHTFGCALDLNAEWNGFKQKPAAPGAKGSVWRLVPVFEEYGFECGAKWKRVPDGMHMEVKRILSAAELGKLAGSVAPPKPAADPTPSIVITDASGRNTRITTEKRPAGNVALVADTLKGAGIKYTVATWGDGSPNVRVIK